MQAAKPANQLMARPQIKMIGVGEDDFGAKPFEPFLCERFDRTLSAHRQEKRRLHDPVWRGQSAAARAGGVCFQDFKGKTHPLSVSGEDEGPAHTAKNVDGPDAEGNCERFPSL